MALMVLKFQIKRTVVVNYLGKFYDFMFELDNKEGL